MLNLNDMMNNQIYMQNQNFYMHNQNIAIFQLHFKSNFLKFFKQINFNFIIIKKY